MAGLPPVQFLSVLSVDDDTLSQLATMSFSETGTRRICLHESEASPLHAMLVESVAGSSFPGHYHADSDEVTIVIKGRLEMLVWDKGTNAAPTRLVLGDAARDIRVAFVRKDLPHVTRVIGSNCVYLEVKLGPFKKDALVWV